MSAPQTQTTTSAEGMKKWLVDAGIKDLELIEKYVQGLASQGYTEASLMHHISPGTLEKAGVGLHSDMILAAAKGETICNSWGWWRDLTMECVEPNPGPSMTATFSAIANQFGEGSEEAVRIRADLKLVEDAIKAWKKGEYAYTDVHVKQFFTEKTVGDIRTIVGDAAAATIWREVRVHLSLDQAALPQVPPGGSGAAQDSQGGSGGEGNHNLDTIFAGLPALSPQRISSSAASIPHDHERAELIECEFKPLSDLPQHTTYPSVIRAYARNSPLDWASESDVQGFVKMVMKDAINAVNLDHLLCCYNELSVFRWRTDIWIVVNRFGVPVGVIEVKKPDEMILHNPHTHGQVLDYMYRLKHFFGQSVQFGIATTYKKWRLYTSKKDAAQAESVDKAKELSKGTSIIPKSVNSWVGGLDVAAVPEPTFPKTPEGKRRVYGSRIIPFDDPALIPLLMTMVTKMLYAPRETIPIFHPKRRYIVLTEDSLYWDSLRKEVNQLDFSRMPSSSAKQLFLLEDMRAGADGRAWLVCSSTGRVGVLKFLLIDKPNDQLHQEAEQWNKVWNIPARVGKFGGELGLLMPYVFPCTDEEQQKKKEVRAAVILAVEKLAKKCVHHLDVKWGHVGLFHDFQKKLHAVLFDFSRVERVHKNQQDEIKWSMLSKLGILEEDM